MAEAILWIAELFSPRLKAVGYVKSSVGFVLLLMFLSYKALPCWRSSPVDHLLCYKSYPDGLRRIAPVIGPAEAIGLSAFVFQLSTFN
ncbi:MAG: hypothetical protein WDN75_08010 [Bacteroidota bacterium]